MWKAGSIEFFGIKLAYFRYFVMFLIKRNFREYKNQTQIVCYINLNAIQNKCLFIFIRVNN